MRRHHIHASRSASALVALAVLGGQARASGADTMGPAAATPDAAAAAPGAAIMPPRLVAFVPAAFPPAELARGRGAAVVLELSIDVSGRVAAVSVVEPASPAFDAAAAAAAARFVFAPATRAGVPVPVTINYRYQFTLTEPPAPKRTADFGGIVRERRTKRPLAHVRVALDTGAGALSAEDGRFSIPDVPPGAHGVTLSGELISTVGTQELLEGGHRLDATYDVELKKVAAASDDDEEQIMVTAPRLRKQVVSTEVRSGQAQKVPGAQGDVLKVVESLPGVARASVGSGALLVWGASPRDTRVYIDGIHVPRLYHDGGFRSVLPSDLVKAVELAPGGYGATYGRGLGGVVSVTSLPLDEPGFHGGSNADIIEAAADARASLGPAHFALGFRRSHLDATLPLATSDDVGSYVPIPRYWDGQARLAFDLGPHESIELGALASGDRIDHGLVDADPALSTRQSSTTQFARAYARYARRTTEGEVIDVTPWFGVDSTGLLSLFGSLPIDVEDRSTLFGLRASWRGKLAEHVRASAGFDAEATFSHLHRAGSIGAPAREGDVFVFGEPPPAGVTVDDWTTVLAGLGAFGELDASLLGDRVHVTPGLRLEPTLVATNKTIPTHPETAVGRSQQTNVVDPRLTVSATLTSRLDAKAAFGRYHQSPEPEDLSAVFGTPTLGLSSAEHYLAGLGLHATPDTALEVTGFLTELHALPVRSQADSPYVAHALDQTGRGRSYGAQVLLRRQQRGRFFGWISYTLARSERKDAPGLAWRLFDYDQTHVFTAVGSYDVGRGFDLGLRLRYATGYPRTPVEGSYYDAQANLYQPIFGPHNGTRIPAFASIDVRIAKSFRWHQWRGEVYLDVQNLSNRRNPEEIVYNATFTQRGYITGMPLLPVVGARLSW